MACPARSAIVSETIQEPGGRCAPTSIRRGVVMVKGTRETSGGHQMWSYPLDHRIAYAGEDDERCAHGGHRVPNECARRDAERERERGVADGCDVAGVEVGEGSRRRRQVEWAGLPRHQEAAQPGNGHRRKPQQASLHSVQRGRETVCVQANRKVPLSSSRATSGAPQKTPMSPGTT
jgi:hypothetical protein